jgi:tRNA(fMet)-specific endonuclease VapC
LLPNAKTYRRSFGHYTLSTVSVMEVVSGFQRTQATGRLNAFLATLSHMEILPFEQSAAELAGRIAGDLERSGQPIGVADTMIAAIAIDNGLELVTGNTSNYQRVQQLGYPLTLANWRL